MAIPVARAGAEPDLFALADPTPRPAGEYVSSVTACLYDQRHCATGTGTHGCEIGRRLPSVPVGGRSIRPGEGSDFRLIACRGMIC